MVASVMKNPTMIKVTLLSGRILSGRALWRLLTFANPRRSLRGFQRFSEVFRDFCGKGLSFGTIKKVLNPKGPTIEKDQSRLIA